MLPIVTGSWFDVNGIPAILLAIDLDIIIAGSHFSGGHSNEQTSFHLAGIQLPYETYHRDTVSSGLCCR
jgi:hypothetical protein